MRSISRLANAALVAAALMVGCSSSSNNNNDGSMSSGYQPTTKLTTLTTPQLQMLCMQESANGTGAVSCGDAGTVTTAFGVCTSITADCSATVATSQTCATKLATDACNPAAYNADLKTPECLVMQECTGVLCANVNDRTCLCPDYDHLNTCTVTCKSFTRGLTTDCAACLANLFTASMCPDFTNLSAPYDSCPAICAIKDGGTKG